MPAKAAPRLVTPVTGYRLRERHSEWGQRGARFHHGIDLYADVGTPVFAVADGIVDRSVANGTPGFNRYGQTVIIEHPDLGVRSLYAHLSRRDVRAGESVRAGQVIGAVGTTVGTVSDPDATFEVSDPHVHFEVLTGAYPASAGGPPGPIRSVDPRVFFEEHNQEFGVDSAGQSMAKDSFFGPKVSLEEDGVPGSRITPWLFVAGGGILVAWFGIWYYRRSRG